MTSRYNAARNYGEAVVEMEFPSGFLHSVDVKNASVIQEDRSVKLDGRPADWREFRAHVEQQVMDAAVWEIVDTEKTPDEIVRNAVTEKDPEHEDFERLEFYPAYTQFAEERGFEVVYWAETEIVLVDYSAPYRVVPANEAAKQAVVDDLSG
jgi:hypothetical protein